MEGRGATQEAAGPRTTAILQSENLKELFQAGGILSRHLPGFELRRQQLEMLGKVLDAYNQDQVALVEAGTGTGKSLAYLVPALMWAAENQERTVVSTNTINLQEQLMKKDIPFLKKALGIDVKAVLVKGMGNYLCLRKFEDALDEGAYLNPEEQEELTRIDQWRASTNDGSKSSLRFLPKAQTWEKIRVEGDQCNGQRCPFYEDCFFFKARAKAANAQLLVVNHHLLFADLAARQETNNFKQPCILPSYDRIIIDEAHHVEDVATEYFASRVSNYKLGRVLGQLASDSRSRQHGKLLALRDKFGEYYAKDPPDEVKKIFQRLSIDLPAQRERLPGEISKAFDALTNFLFQSLNLKWDDDNPVQGARLRIQEEHRQHPFWTERVMPAARALVEEGERYITSIRACLEDIRHLENQKLNEQLDGTQLDVSALCNRLELIFSDFHAFVEGEADDADVRWIETQQRRGQQDCTAVKARLDIDETLAKVLFSRFRTIVLCSATLSTNRNFQFIQGRLGIRAPFLDATRISQSIYDSPFNYPEQALLCVPSDMPSPKSSEFFDAAVETIAEAVVASHGNAFVLFTSYQMLNRCFNALEARLKRHRIGLLKQGQDSRSDLLSRFVKEDRSVLLGTDSFWEGVDVAGEALRQVILVKLPFQVPSEPIVQARSERLEKMGFQPFFHYSVPNAIVKFKQGFGRLIRKAKDRGVILCLDNRLLTGNYGKAFLNSLPPCQRFAGNRQAIVDKMRDFYKKTYRLTLSD